MLSRPGAALELFVQRIAQQLLFASLALRGALALSSSDPIQGSRRPHDFFPQDFMHI
jgi:hypothetical protein